MERDVFKTLEQLEKGTPTDQVIVLKSVYKTGKTTVQPVTDGLGWYLGVERLSEDQKKGRIFWATPETKYTIKNGTTFDLNDESQRLTWEWVKHSPCIALSEEDCQFTPGAEFFVFLENEEATKNITRRELKYKAMEYIMTDAITNYPLRTSLLGVDMEGAKPNVIKDFLLEEAEKSPDTVIAIYESHDLSFRLLLMKALKKHIIVKDQGGIFRYGNTVLGMTEASCISWMQDNDNKHIVELLEKEVEPEYFKKEEAEGDIKPAPEKLKPKSKDREPVKKAQRS